MSYHVYILLCENDVYYTGHCRNLNLRLAAHKKGKGAKFTVKNKPIKIVWSQKFSSEMESIERELQIKGWTRKKKEKLIQGIWK